VKKLARANAPAYFDLTSVTGISSLKSVTSVNYWTIRGAMTISIMAFNITTDLKFCIICILFAGGFAVIFIAECGRIFSP
jgi:hypothetical protein